MASWSKNGVNQPGSRSYTVVKDESDDKFSTKVSSHNGGSMIRDDRPVPTPDSIALDMQDQKLLDECLTNGVMGLPVPPQPDLLSRGNKRLKEDGEVSISLQDVKRRKSSSFESRQLCLPDSSDPKSPISIPSPLERLPGTDNVGSDTVDDYVKQVDANHPSHKLLRDLETRAITVPQLVQEVKGIYAGLAMVERKCIEIVDVQLKSTNKLTKEQWQALIALHRTLLNEHHDFFSASHHPVTKGHELRELATRHAMPARMWRHGIHAFLELLRHKLPDSHEHMVSFLCLSYSMVTLLKETLPEFLETWIECLGDLARYRMAIEETGLRDREVWAIAARTWYNQAADLSPDTGRIQHHLAVLARPHIVQQLFLYSKALVAAVPFQNAAESILLLFNPLLDHNTETQTRHTQADFNFVCAAATLFKRRNLDDFAVFRGQFESSFQSHLSSTGVKFKVQGPEYAGSLFAMLMDYGNEENTIWRMILGHQQEMKQIYCKQNGEELDRLPKDFVMRDPDTIDSRKLEYWSQTDIPAVIMPTLPQTDRAEYSSDEVSSSVSPMFFQAISDVADNIGNKNVVPFMHVVLAYLFALTWVPKASVHTESSIPWEGLAKFLNTVGRSGVSYETVEGAEFPKSFGGSRRQLPEDFVMRGLMVMTYYYKDDIFDKDVLLDEDERLLEQPSHQTPRVERCLWAAHKLAALNGRWLTYDQETKMFSATGFAKTLALQRQEKAQR